MYCKTSQAVRLDLNHSIIRTFGVPYFCKMNWTTELWWILIILWRKQLHFTHLFHYEPLKVNWTGCRWSVGWGRSSTVRLNWSTSLNSDKYHKCYLSRKTSQIAQKTSVGQQNIPSIRPSQKLEWLVLAWGKDHWVQSGWKFISFVKHYQ